MKRIYRDLKNTFVIHWSVGSDRATPREYLTAELFSLFLLTISTEFFLFLALGDVYWDTDTSTVYTAVQAIYFFLDLTGGFSIWLFIYLLLQIFILVPLICLDWRRLHDFGWSGWNVLWIWLISSIPYVTWLVTLFMFLKKGDPGENKYGLPVNYDISQNDIEEEENPF